jgi:hypothetical protein
MTLLRRLAQAHDWYDSAGTFCLQVGLYLTWPHSAAWARLALAVGLMLGVALVRDMIGQREVQA